MNVRFIFLTVVLMTVFACAPKKKTEEVDPETNTGQTDPSTPTTTTLPPPVMPDDPGPLPPVTPTPEPIIVPDGPRKFTTLTGSFFIRTFYAGILEPVDWLPAGSVVEIVNINPVRRYQYRDYETKALMTSAHGFQFIVGIKSVPGDAGARYTPERIQELLTLSGALFISNLAEETTMKTYMEIMGERPRQDEE